jgi:hypothetical protein
MATSAGCRHPKRIFALGTRFRSRSAADLRRTRDRLRSLEPPWPGLPYWDRQCQHNLRHVRRSQLVPPLHARGNQGQSADSRSARCHCDPEECDARSDRARLAVGSEALHCADPRHTKVDSPTGKSWRGGHRTHAGQPPGIHTAAEKIKVHGGRGTGPRAIRLIKFPRVANPVCAEHPGGGQHHESLGHP